MSNDKYKDALHLCCFSYFQGLWICVVVSFNGVKKHGIRMNSPALPWRSFRTPHPPRSSSSPPLHSSAALGSKGRLGGWNLGGETWGDCLILKILLIIVNLS